MDEGLRFVLYHAEVGKFHLSEGAEIPDATLREILEVLLPKRAKLCAMNLLKARDYTEARLAEKLQNGGYPEAVIGEAIAYVKSYGYVDDARYARAFVRSRMARVSRMKLRGELMQRGIDGETADEAIDELYADGLLAGEDPELNQIRKLMAKKDYDPATATWEERQKFFAAMVRRGFSPDKVRRVAEEEKS